MEERVSRKRWLRFCDAAGRWRTRRGWAPIAVLVIAGLTAAAITAAVGPDSQSSDDLVTPEAVVLARHGSSEPGPPPPPDVPGALHYEQVLDIAVLGDTLVAVGDRAVKPRDQRPDLSLPLTWWSDDSGAHWNSVPLPGTGRLRSVAAVGDRFIAVGYAAEPHGMRALVLSSRDGRSWTEEDVPGIDVLLDTVVATPAGAILGGGRTDLSGRVPVAFVPQKAGGWHQIPLLAEAGGRQGEIRGGCSHGDEVTLVGMVVDDGENYPLILRSFDAGETWRAIKLPGSALVGTEPRANSCDVAAGRTAVVGTAEVRGYDRAWVSVERKGSWQDAHLLEPTNLDRPGHTLGAAAAALGSEFVVIGHDTSYDEPASDLAVWQSSAEGWTRLDAVNRLGAGAGVGVGFSAVAVRGVLVVGGTSADRAVVWRSSPQLAVTPPSTTVTTIETWWARYRSTDVCRLLDHNTLQATLGPNGGTPRLLPNLNGPVISCTWSRDDRSLSLSIEIAPARRLEAFEANYPHSLPPPKPVTGVCQDGRYYAAFTTMMARCGDTVVAVSGPPEDEGVTLLKVIAKGLAD